jgi:two-component system LytT family response regulator
MRALIIDDEESNRWLVASMLNKHCAQVEVVGDASSVDEAMVKIKELKPELVFLDVKMPGKNGFDLLRLLAGEPIEVIFITGFDEYAVMAFEFNAIDYVLKPVDYIKLIAAVNKAEIRLRSSMPNNLVHFVQCIEEKTNLIQKIMLHTNDKVNIVDLEEVLFFMADRGYCEVHTTNKCKYVSAKTLADYEVLLKPLPNFIRVNKSYIINIRHMDSYTKGAICQVLMKGSDHEIDVSRRRKNEIVALLKKLMVITPVFI